MGGARESRAGQATSSSHLAWVHLFFLKRRGEQEASSSGLLLHGESEGNSGPLEAKSYYLSWYLVDFVVVGMSQQR